MMQQGRAEARSPACREPGGGRAERSRRMIDEGPVSIRASRRAPHRLSRSRDPARTRGSLVLATLAAALLASAAPQTSPAEAAPAPEAALDWSALAVADVEAAYAETKANHPGMFDPVNPAFPQLLETARSEALALARQAGEHARRLRGEPRAVHCRAQRRPRRRL